MILRIWVKGIEENEMRGCVCIPVSLFPSVCEPLEIICWWKLMFIPQLIKNWWVRLPLVCFPTHKPELLEHRYWSSSLETWQTTYYLAFGVFTMRLPQSLFWKLVWSSNIFRWNPLFIFFYSQDKIWVLKLLLSWPKYSYLCIIFISNLCLLWIYVRKLISK